MGSRLNTLVCCQQLKVISAWIFYHSFTVFGGQRNCEQSHRFCPFPRNFYICKKFCETWYHPPKLKMQKAFQMHTLVLLGIALDTESLKSKKRLITDCKSKIEKNSDWSGAHNHGSSVGYIQSCASTGLVVNHCTTTM